MGDFFQAEFEHAVLLIQSGNIQGAIEVLKKVLAEEPDFSGAHAFLSLCLLDQKRLAAADAEARMAVTLDPEDPFPLFVLARVQLAERRFSEADFSLNQALALNPGFASGYLVRSQLMSLTGRDELALPDIVRALELEPNEPEHHEALGRWHLDRGEIDKAHQKAHDALAINPEDHGALVLMGQCLLRRGEVSAARDHALWALRQDPRGHQALQLLSAIKARENFFLGLWWRYQTWMNELGEMRSIAVLLGAFALYSTLLIATRQFNVKEWGEILKVLWLCLCIYTWVGPELFERSVRKELDQVEFRENF